MRPSEVRDRVLQDHEALRARLARIDDLVRGTSRDGSDGGALREAADALLARLAEHMQWEDRYLVPALRQADAWGEERARRFEDEHREQREFLTWLVADLQDPGKPAAVLASHIEGFVAQLRADMEEEESFFLDSKVLRDDVVVIDAFSG